MGRGTAKGRPWVATPEAVGPGATLLTITNDQRDPAPPIPPAGGAVHHSGGGARSRYGRDAERTHLEWQYDEFAEAAGAARRIGEMSALDRISVAPSKEWRRENPGELVIRHGDAYGRGVRCPSCRSHIAGGEDLSYALQGRQSGDEAIVICKHCGLAVAWRVGPER